MLKNDLTFGSSDIKNIDTVFILKVERTVNTPLFMSKMTKKLVIY